MRDVRISGRMEETHDSQSNTLAIVDYAHNYASVNALLDYVEQRYGNEHPHITLVTTAICTAVGRSSSMMRSTCGSVT